MTQYVTDLKVYLQCGHLLMEVDFPRAIPPKTLKYCQKCQRVVPVVRTQVVSGDSDEDNQCSTSED